MSSIIVNEQRYPIAPGATVLDTLLDAGLEVAYGCRAGACQSCLVRATEGEIPVDAQHGLKDTLKTEGWFLACRCEPTEALTLDLNARAVPSVKATVSDKKALSSRVMGLWLETEQPFPYRAGQYITLWKDDSSGRSYSLASLPYSDTGLELHIARIDGGAVSPWIHEHLQVGDNVNIQGPLGECFYSSDKPEQPLLLIGTGTGLAPIYGVLKDALKNGHHGPIHLYHGARTSEYLYYHEELVQLANRHANLHYHPSIVEAIEGLAAEVEIGAIDKLVSQQLPDLKGWRVFLSGAPDIVNQLRKYCFLAGAASKEIHTDPFS